MVVLDILSGQTVRLELVGAESFGEKTAAILKNVGNQNDYIVQLPGLDSNIHANARPLLQ
jgi:hypothetical protein